MYGHEIFKRRESSIGQPTCWAASLVRRAFSFSGVRFLLGGILLAAASLKAELLFMTAAWPFGAGLFETGPFGAGEFGLVLFELAFAGWLFSGRLTSYAWWAATGCFATFATVAAFKVLHGDADCGCFGVIRTPPWVALSIDVTALVALLATYHGRTTTGAYRSTFFSRLPGAVGYALIFLVATKISLPLVLADGLSRSNASNSDPSRWVGRRFPLLEEIDIGPELSSGECIVVLHRHGCPLCDETLNAAWFRDAAHGAPGLNRIALIELPPYENAQEADFSRFGLTGRLNSDKPYPLPVPVVVLLEEGRVTSVAVGEQSRVRLREVLGQSPGPVVATRLDLPAKPRETIAFAEPRE